MTIGARFALAEYMAAVRPAGPEPTITTFACWVTVDAFLYDFFETLRPHINIPARVKIPPRTR